MTLMQEKITRLRNAVSFKKTDIIPSYSNFYTYVLLDGGHSFKEVLPDYGKVEAALRRFHEKYNFDLYGYMGNTTGVLISPEVDGAKFNVDYERDILSIRDYALMSEDEYPQLIADPVKFFWEVCIPRKCKGFTKENIQKAADKYVAESEFTMKTVRMFLEEFQVPMASAAFTRSPAEILFNNLRGIKGFSIDLRRRYSQIKEAIEVLAVYDGMPNAFKSFDKPVPETCAFGMFLPYLGHSVLNFKQFEDLYWPLTNKVINKCAETDRQVYIFSESSMERFADLFADAPKGVVAIHPEADNVFELRKKLPNIAISGGMTRDCLSNGSKEDCLNLAKKLVDEVGADGGYIMSQNKMIAYRNDAKPENILAVQEFCRTYKG